MPSAPDHHVDNLPLLCPFCLLTFTHALQRDGEREREMFPGITSLLTVMQPLLFF